MPPPLSRVSRTSPAEAVGGQPLPRVELEAAADEPEPVVHEAAREPVPADALDGEGLGLQPGLLSGLAQIRDRHQVLAELVAVRVHEVEGAGRKQAGLLPPCVDEPFVEGVPLIGAGEPFLHPEPLRARGLHERGGGVGVVLQHLGRAGAVVAQIEPPVEGRKLGAPPPGLGDQGGELRIGHPQLGEPVPLDDVRGRRETHRVELLDDLLERLDLGQAEGVVRALVPVRTQRIVRVTGQRVDEPLLLHRLLPARTGLDGVPSHVPDLSQPPPEPEQPKPPVSTAFMSKLPPLTRLSRREPP